MCVWCLLGRVYVLYLTPHPLQPPPLRIKCLVYVDIVIVTNCTCDVIRACQLLFRDDSGVAERI